MPRGILQFTLPEDDGEWRIACRSMDWALAMSDLDNRLREIVKYHSDDYGADEIAAFENVRDWLRECLSDRGISLEDIE